MFLKVIVTRSPQGSWLNPPLDTDLRSETDQEMVTYWTSGIIIIAAFTQRAAYACLQKYNPRALHL